MESSKPAPQKTKLLSESFDATTKTPVVLVLVCDSTYVPYAGVTIASVLRQADPKQPYDIIVVGDGTTALDQEKLKSLVRLKENTSITLHSASHAQIDALKPSRGWSRTVFYKLVISEILNDFDKVIYLDCDVLAYRDLGHLFATELRGYHIGACQDPSYRMYVTHKRWRYGIKETDDMRRYFLSEVGILEQNLERQFNTGVLLLSLENFRQNAFTEKALSYLREKPRQPIFVDQDIFNYIYQGHYFELDRKWNVMDHLNQFSEVLSELEADNFSDAKNNPYIYHFTAPQSKPWKGSKSIFSSDWWKSARLTPWYEDLLIDRMSRYSPFNRTVRQIARKEAARQRLSSVISRRLRSFFGTQQ